MAIFMLITWIPTNQIEKALKIAASVTKLPPYIKKWQQLAAMDKKGSKSYNIIYTDDKNIEEAMRWIAKVMSLYYEIEGFSYEVEPVFSMRDVPKVMGMKI